MFSICNEDKPRQIVEGAVKSARFVTVRTMRNGRRVTHYVIV